MSKDSTVALYSKTTKPGDFIEESNTIKKQKLQNVHMLIRIMHALKR